MHRVQPRAGLDAIAQSILHVPHARELLVAVDVRMAVHVHPCAGAPDLLVERRTAARLDDLVHRGDRELLAREEVREAHNVPCESHREPRLVDAEHERGRRLIPHRPLAPRVEADAAWAWVVPIKAVRVPALEREHRKPWRELRGTLVVRSRRRVGVMSKGVY